MKKDFLSATDLSKKEIDELFTLTKRLKQSRQSHEKPLQGKTFALIFMKPSLRTRVTLETAIYELGGTPIYLSQQDIGLGSREAVKDIAQSLSQWVTGIMARVFAHQTVVELAKYATVPVINALSDWEHPCQVLADLFTIYERFKTFKKIKLVYLGDGNNICRSLIEIAKICNLDMWAAIPKGYEPYPTSSIQYTESKILNDPIKAVKDADIVYTDVWASMGQENEREERIRIFKEFQVNSKLLKHAKPNCLIMHCLPAHREEEITSEVLDSPNSIVLQQAENRLHTQKALLVKLYKTT